jgi:MFS-type transporter involved in bile tolerance (Atg22 family)
MSEESFPGSVERVVAMTPLADSVTGPTEFDLTYYGWRVVFAPCLGVMAGFGSLLVYTFSVFGKPLAAEFGWSREAISSGFAIAAITLGVISPLLGRWIDRFGPRRIILRLHDDIRVCHRLVVAVALRFVAVLYDLLRAGFGW